ncbi:hypothetical protein GTG28_20680 [Vibrio sp. OCN044]|uniref:Uncharacterized protein n=1 Tax=Vibrio tetraodonis subsp. pristinus TaxID=2695891 RepID=A0A6L8M2V0_9VIBR|nr:hypothetical protein [Vibrio tetraodonis]MYM61620.1 hypothetical protein [Vibrio tetraodonis subsp. pristinus]
MWTKFKKLTGTQKTKAAVLAAFFYALYLSLQTYREHMPNWLYHGLMFLSQMGSAFFGGI